MQQVQHTFLQIGQVILIESDKIKSSFTDIDQFKKKTKTKKTKKTKNKNRIAKELCEFDTLIRGY